MVNIPFLFMNSTRLMVPFPSVSHCAMKSRTASLLDFSPMDFSRAVTSCAQRKRRAYGGYKSITGGIEAEEPQRAQACLLVEFPRFVEVELVEQDRHRRKGLEPFAGLLRLELIEANPSIAVCVYIL